MDDIAQHEAFKAAQHENEKLRALAEFIIDGYANQNLSHEDFRVGAYQAALKSLGR